MRKLFSRVAAPLAGMGFALAITAAPAQADVFYIQTGQQGAQVQLDSAHPNSWILLPTVNFDLGGGNFTMKEGTSTLGSITFTVYDGPASTDPVLATLIFTRDQFCDAHDGVIDNVGSDNCQTFNPVPFHFANVVPLLAGEQYFVELLANTAPDQQSQAYFIKGLDDIFLPTGEDPQPPLDVPEPASLALLGLSLLGMGLARRRRG